MPFISINVTGLTDIIGGVSEFINNLPQTNQNIIDETTDLFVRTAKTKVHVITGKTKNSVRGQRVTQKQGLVEAHWGAKFEEQRSGTKGALGPHKFLTESSNVVRSAMPDIIRRHYDSLINRIRRV